MVSVARYGYWMATPRGDAERTGLRKNIANPVHFLESGEALKSILSLEVGSQAGELLSFHGCTAKARSSASWA
jgi:hypothetical protein